MYRERDGQRHREIRMERVRIQREGDGVGKCTERHRERDG